MKLSNARLSLLKQSRIAGFLYGRVSLALRLLAETTTEDTAT